MKTVLLEKVISSNENKWINQNDLFLGYQDIIEDNIFNAKLIKLIDDKEINVFESKLAKIDDTKIVFDDDQQVNFVIPIQSRISIKNIQNENISELYYLKKLFIESKLEDDILFNCEHYTKGERCLTPAEWDQAKAWEGYYDAYKEENGISPRWTNWTDHSTEEWNEKAKTCYYFSA